MHKTCEAREEKKKVFKRFWRNHDTEEKLSIDKNKISGINPGRFRAHRDRV